MIILAAIGAAFFLIRFGHHQCGGTTRDCYRQQGMRMGVSKRRLAKATYETAINEAIAACHGDLRGTLKALLMANEYLEAALADAQSALQFAGAGDVAFAASRPRRLARR
jgi:hypothetical protein